MTWAELRSTFRFETVFGALRNESAHCLEMLDGWGMLRWVIRCGFLAVFERGWRSREGGSENFGKGGFEPLRSAIGIFDDLEWQREVDLALYF